MGRKAIVITLTALLGAMTLGLTHWVRSPRLEELRFRNGEVTLAGTLHVPPGAGPHPAVLFIHGSGDDTRQNYRHLADILARRGIAALIYDKRGVAASTGSWKTSPFSALADDALAGIEVLKRHPAIDARRIGAWGGSEGAVIAPWIATRSADVTFVIMQAATGVPFAQQNLHQQERRLRAMAIPEADVAEGLRIVHLQQHYARTGTGWQAYADARHAARDKAWASVLGALLPADNWWWTWYRTKMDHDPIPMLEKVRVPVLAVWGENDVLVPLAESRAAIEGAFTRSGNRALTCRVYAGADHSIQTESWLHGVGVDPSYLDLMCEWVQAQTRTPK